METQGYLELSLPKENYIHVWKEQLLNNPYVWKSLTGDSEEKKQLFTKWFEALSLAAQEKIVMSTMGVSSNLDFDEISPEQEFNFLKKFLYRYKLRPVDEDVFSRITDEDFIEVYDSQGIQIYRSWNFFKFCRYTIDDILTKSWGELYERPEFVHKKLMNLMPKLFSEGSKTVDYHIEEFILTERFITPKANYKVKMKFACPLVDIESGHVAAFISVASAKRIDN